MRRPRWQKVLADLRSNPTRSLLVIASIAVGLFALGVMATIYAVSMEDIQRGYALHNPANIAIQGTLISQGLVERIAAVDGVRQHGAGGRAIARVERRGERALERELRSHVGEFVL